MSPVGRLSHLSHMYKYRYLYCIVAAQKKKVPAKSQHLLFYLFSFNRELGHLHATTHGEDAHQAQEASATPEGSGSGSSNGGEAHNVGRTAVDDADAARLPAISIGLDHEILGATARDRRDEVETNDIGRSTVHSRWNN